MGGRGGGGGGPRCLGGGLSSELMLLVMLPQLRAGEGCGSVVQEAAWTLLFTHPAGSAYAVIVVVRFHCCRALC